MLRPFISHSFRSPVWRLEIDSQSNTLVTEVRDPSDKKVYFSSVSLETGKLNFEDLETEERWLTGLETAYGGVLLLHHYESESGPVHKGLTAIDELTGKVLWSNFNLAFDFLSINGPIVYDTRLQPRKLLLADIKTGATVRAHEPSIDLELYKELSLPETLPAEFIQSLHLPVHPAENYSHCLEHNGRRIVSLHTIAEGALQQHLYIVSGGEIIYHDLLNSRIQKLQPESFMLYQDYLIYLKNQSQLHVLNM